MPLLVLNQKAKINLPKIISKSGVAYYSLYAIP
jgi:hypothetical protein